MLTTLISVFVTLLVAFAVLMAAHLLAVAVQDSQLAVVLRIIGIVCLLLLVIGAVLLLLALALRALAAETRRELTRSRIGQPTRETQPPDNSPSAGDEGSKAWRRVSSYPHRRGASDRRLKTACQFVFVVNIASSG